MVIIIAAIGSDNIIGNGKGLPWHIPSEYNQFLGHIRGQTVIMGRRSYEIFKNEMLPKRMVVVSRSLKPGLVSVFASLSEALRFSRTFEEDIYICGGQAIYEESIPLADSMYLSFIRGEHQGNVYFPAFDAGDWLVETRETHDAFDFVIFRRKKALDSQR